MHSVVLTLGRDDLAAAEGALVAANVDRPGGGHLLRKGQRVGPDEVAALLTLVGEAPGRTVSLLRLDADDVDEGEAAQLLGAALAGPGVTVRGPSEGRTRLRAAQTGLLLIDSARLAAANAVPGVSLYTLFGGTPVAANTVVAEAKVTLLAAPRARVDEAVRILAGSGGQTTADRRQTMPEAIADPKSKIQNPKSIGPALAVWPFVPRRAALLIRERLAPDAAARMAGLLRKKLAWFGTELDAANVVHASDDAVAVAGHLTRLLDAGTDLLFTAGGSTSDPADATLRALDALDARLLRQGVPIHPGSLLWVAQCGAALIVGVPSCGTFSEQTSLDVLLPRLLALGADGLVGIERLAEGGLLARGQEYRYPPYGKLDES